MCPSGPFGILKKQKGVFFFLKDSLNPWLKRKLKFINWLHVHAPNNQKVRKHNHPQPGEGTDAPLF